MSWFLWWHSRVFLKGQVLTLYQYFWSSWMWRMRCTTFPCMHFGREFHFKFASRFIIKKISSVWSQRKYSWSCCSDPLLYHIHMLVMGIQNIWIWLRALAVRGQAEDASSSYAVKFWSVIIYFWSRLSTINLILIHWKISWHKFFAVLFSNKPKVFVLGVFVKGKIFLKMRTVVFSFALPEPS